jgi:hypothetical protein
MIHSLAQNHVAHSSEHIASEETGQRLLRGFEAAVYRAVR